MPSDGVPHLLTLGGPVVMPVKGWPQETIDLCEDAADVAIDTGQMVPIYGLALLVVPDVILLQGLANGMTVPPTMTLRRADRRTASVYRLPRAGAA